MRKLESLASYAVATVFFAAGFPRAATSQVSDKLVPDAVACGTCRISATHLVTIADTLVTDGPTDMARDSRGRFYAILSPHGLVAVFDERGR